MPKGVYKRNGRKHRVGMVKVMESMMLPLPSSLSSLSKVNEEFVDVVNNPPHYIANGVEVINVIDAFGLDFYTGTVLAYILRAGRKKGCTRLEDLKKAQWYLNRLVVLEDK